MKILSSLGIALSIFCASARADQVKYLPEAEGALAQYLENIESAKTSIDITFYIWDPCSVVGRVLVRAIEKKTKQNPSIKVRLLLDASLHNEKGRSEITATLAHRGIETRFFNYSGFADVRRNVRTHVKFMNVDGKRYITGGRNIADDYYGLSGNMNWIDREVHVEGASAAQATEGFNQLWTARMTRPERRVASAAEVKKSEEGCLKADKKVLAVEKYLANNRARILGKSPSINCSDVTMAVDRADFMDVVPNPGNDEPEFLSGERLQRKQASREIMKTLSGSTQSLLFENYTYIPTSGIHRVIENFREKKLPMTMIINNAADEDQGVMKAPATYYQKEHATGSQSIIAIPKGHFVNDNWAMTPGNPTYQIHSKVFVSDNKNAIVSSFNMDPRSYHTNLESAAVVRNCPKFAAQVKMSIDKTYGRAMKLLQDPTIKYCIEQKEVPPEMLNRLLGWMAHEFL